MTAILHSTSPETSNIHTLENTLDKMILDEKENGAMEETCSVDENVMGDINNDDGIDEILKPNDARFTLFPIKYSNLWQMYKKAVESFWVAEEIELEKDLDDWNNKLNDDERFYIEHILAFFAQADGIVNENILLRFQKEVTVLEAQYFYQFQGMIENVHAEVYALFIDTYISDPDKRQFLFNAIDNVPCVKKKADWALKWISSKEASFGERLLAFACVEGIFFSGSFAAIFWLRKRGLLTKGLGQANTLISRDEGLHQSFACLLYRDYLHHSKPSPERAYQIVREACEIEKEFQTEALPVSLIGMNKDLMAQYIEYVSDMLLGMIDLDPIYKTQNPFDFMDLISMIHVGNFFEGKDTNYRIGTTKREWTLEADF
jgi:ribonucleoside-diphosphate reductase subunit M2